MKHYFDQSFEQLNEKIDDANKKNASSFLTLEQKVERLWTNYLPTEQELMNFPKAWSIILPQIHQAILDQTGYQAHYDPGCESGSCAGSEDGFR